MPKNLTLPHFYGFIALYMIILISNQLRIRFNNILLNLKAS